MIRHESCDRGTRRIAHSVHSQGIVNEIRLTGIREAGVVGMGFYRCKKHWAQLGHRRDETPDPNLRHCSPL